MRHRSTHLPVTALGKRADPGIAGHRWAVPVPGGDVKTNGVSVTEWYFRAMSGTYQVTMGDRGRLVIPVQLREQYGLAEGTTMTVVATPKGLVLFSRSQLQQAVREDLAGLDLVGELLAERRAAANSEDDDPEVA